MRRWPIVVVVLLFIAAPQVALACSCALVSKTDAARAVQVVFTGRVVNVTHPFALGFRCAVSSTDPVVAAFIVESVYKGELPETATVRTVAGGASCGYDFEDGRRYTVFATVGSNGLETNLCRGNVEGPIDPADYGLAPAHPPKT